MTEIERNNKPLPAGEINFSLPGIHKFKNANGLQVLFIEKKKLPIIQINLLFNAGSKFDPEGKKGLANLLAMCIDEGAGKYDALQLSDEFDILGTHFNINTTEDNIYFSIQSLSEHFHRSIELLSDVINKPRFDEQDFERERRKISVRILQIKDEPDEIADLVFDHVVFGKQSPYAFPIIGYEDNIKNINLSDIKNYYKEFLHPTNSALIVVGNTSKEEIEKELNVLFNGKEKGNIRQSEAIPPAEKQTRLYFVDKKDAVQSEIRVGHIASRRNEGDYYKKTILNMILGGQFVSRINLNLRERNGYTYGAISRFSYFKEGANFYVATSVNSENTVNAIKEILNELKEIRNGVSKEELEFAKSSLIRKFPSSFETNKQIAQNLTGMFIHNLPDDYFNSYLNKIKSVSLEDVNQCAVKSILPDEAVIVVVGDKAKLKDELEKFTGIKMIEVDFMGNQVN